MNTSESSEHMDQKCPQCGAPLPSGVLAGLCPACLLKQGAAADTGVAPEAAPFQPPSVEEVARLFPQLEIIGLIGKGGMGAVYKARQPALDRLVALKILPPQTATGPGFLERFNREARALARLNHPNIVAVHEFGQVNGLSFFIMEYVDGVNLRELERAGKLSPREALQIVPQICEALQFAHDEGIVHRDIKPENILLDKKGRVKIADFGIAKILGGGASEPELTQTQSIVGTPHYMAPEQMEKPTAVDHRADIFSLGVVFYEMLTGELPLGKFAPPSSRKVEVDVRLDDVVLRTLEKDPERRYQHASQVKTAVDTIAGTTAPPPVSDAAVLAREILARDYKLNIRSCVRRAWKLLKGEFWPFVGVSALFLALFGFASSFGATTIEHTTQGDSTVEIMSAVALLVFGPLWGGLFFYILKKIRLEPATIETAFSGFNKQRFLHLFLAGFATVALTWLGFLLILPGIYLFVAWMFTLPIVVDKQIDFWSAMELSRKIVTRHWFKLLGFGLVLWLLLFLGVLALVIGILVMFPLVLCTLMYAYEDIFGKATGMAPAPAPAATGPAGTIVMPTVPVQPSHRETWTPATKIGLALVAVLVLVAMVWMVFLAAYRIRPSAREVDNQFTKIVESKQQTAPAETPGPEPPPVPVAASEPAAASSAAMAGAAPAFAPVIELELTNRAAVNLASGEQKALPQYLAEQTRGNDKDMAIVAWMEGADMDVAYVDGSGYSMMAGWASENRDSWNKTNPDSVAAALQKTGRDMGNKLYGTGLDSSTNYTYGFQTRSGHLGLLQFVDFTNESPPYVSIRYQLVEPAASPATIPGAAAGMSPSVLAERLEAAAGITDPDQKDKPLAALAADAAKAGQVLLAKEALADMYNITARDAATQAAAVLLAKHGLRKSAIEMAKGITDTTVRDQTLAELAQ